MNVIEPKLTVAQQLMMALGSARTEVNHIATDDRPKREKAEKPPQRYLRITELVLNPDWTPHNAAFTPQFLVSNRAAKRARRVEHRRSIIADAKRRVPKTEIGTQLRAKLIEKHRRGCIQILEDRIRSTNERAHREGGLDRCGFASNARNRAELNRLGVVA